MQGVHPGQREVEPEEHADAGGVGAGVREVDPRDQPLVVVVPPLVRLEAEEHDSEHDRHAKGRQQQTPRARPGGVHGERHREAAEQ